MADRDALVAQGFQNFNQGLGEGLQKFVQNKRESEFLDGAFEMLVSQRKQMGMQVDPNVLQKFSSGGLGSRRAIVSQLGAENQFAMKSAQENALARNKQQADLLSDLFKRELDRREKEAESRAIAEYSGQDVSKLPPGTAANFASQKMAEESKEEQSNEDRKFQVDLISQISSGMDPIKAIKAAADSNPNASPDMIEKATQSALRSGLTFEQGPDGSFRLSFGGQRGAQDGPTTSTRTATEKSLAASEPMANTIAYLLQNSKPEDYGITGRLLYFKNAASGQIPGLGDFSDKRQMSVGIALDRLKTNAERLADEMTGRISERRLKDIKKNLPLAGEGPQMSVLKIQEFYKEMKNEIRSLAEQGDAELPMWAMFPKEIMDTQRFSKDQKRAHLSTFYPLDYQRLMEIESASSALGAKDKGASLPPVIYTNVVDSIIAPDGELNTNLRK